jgi:hypothetical protein
VRMQVDHDRLSLARTSLKLRGGDVARRSGVDEHP